MGFVFDGDVDWMLVVDGWGCIIDGDYVLFFWGFVLQEYQVFFDQWLVVIVMLNFGFECVWQQWGGIFDCMLVGDQYVYVVMVVSGVGFGGE